MHSPCSNIQNKLKTQMSARATKNRWPSHFTKIHKHTHPYHKFLLTIPGMCTVVHGHIPAFFSYTSHQQFTRACARLYAQCTSICILVPWCVFAFDNLFSFWILVFSNTARNDSPPSARRVDVHFSLDVFFVFQ